MADQKISQLTGATTPLAGTEVLPIVQSSTTKKVSVANLTVGRDVTMESAVINGHANVLGGDVRFDDERFVYSYAGGTVGQYMSGTYYDGSGATQRIYLNNAEVGRWTSGNLQISTAAKGVNFTANTPAAGMTSQLLNWYEEGTFTPTFEGATSAGTTTYTTQSGHYTRIGRSVTVHIYISFSAATGTGAIRIGGLPFTQNANVNGTFSVLVSGYDWTNASYLSGFLSPSTTTFRIFGASDNAGWQEQVVVNSTQIWAISATYFV